MQLLDLADLKARHPIADTLAARGLQLHRAGKSLVAKCPLHGERKGQSFVVLPATGRWRCYGKCNCGGDLFDILAKLDGGTPIEAARKLAGEPPPKRVKSFPATPRGPGAPTTPKRAYDAEAVADMGAACLRLAEDDDVRCWIAESRGWDERVLRAEALSGLLGWEGRRDRGDLLFAFPCGIKRRPWPPPLEGAKATWVAGDANGCMWRQDLLWYRRGRCEWNKPVRRLVILEGEADALSALSAGVEADEETVVLGLPSAGALITPNAEFFRGREVTIMLDADEAGYKGAERLARELHGAGVRVKIADIAAWLPSRKEAA